MAETDGATRAPEPPASDDELGALSYWHLRLWIGRVAAALPVVLVAARGVLDGPGNWPGSISAYYYTSARNVFVGAMCALAAFLFSYRYQKTDNVLSTLAAALALGVALFPTASQGPATAGEKWVRGVHLTCASLFFVCLAVFSLFIFTKSSPAPTPRKKLRNRVYRGCGGIIVATLVLAVANALLEHQVKSYALQDHNALFWLESVAVEAFALSWLVKGGFLLADEKPSAKPA
jgi:hypothetical protein